MRLPGARSQWLWPIALAVAAAVGLPVALFGEGGWPWVVSWLLIGLPLAVIAVALRRR